MPDLPSPLLISVAALEQSRGLQVLSEDCYLDRKNEIPAGKKPWFVLPVFSRYKVPSTFAAPYIYIKNMRVAHC